jgi:hypothetical protein
MTGRRIRWANAGRIAAIVAAVLAGLAVMPALLAEDEPPPLPEDVGLAGVGPPPPPAAAPPVAPEPLPMPAKSDGLAGRPRGKRREAPKRPKLPAEPSRRDHREGRAGRPKEPEADPGAYTPAITYVPTQAPAPAPPAREEFHIED